MSSQLTSQLVDAAGRQLVAVVVSPVKAFCHLANNPSPIKVVPATLLVVGVNAIFFLVVVSSNVYLDGYRNEMPPSFYAQSPAAQAWKLDDIAIGAGIYYLALPFVALVGAVLAAFVLKLSTNILLRRQLSYSDALTIVLYGCVPWLIEKVIVVFMVLFNIGMSGFRMSSPLPVSLGYFLITPESRPLDRALDWVDLFTFWCICLLIVGVSETTGSKRWSAAIPVGVLVIGAFYVAVTTP